MYRPMVDETEQDPEEDECELEIRELDVFDYMTKGRGRREDD